MHDVSTYGEMIRLNDKVKQMEATINAAANADKSSVFPDIKKDSNDDHLMDAAGKV